MSDIATVRGQGQGRFEIVHTALSAPRRYVHAWYFAYLLLGVVTSGILPILLPLWVSEDWHQPRMVGLIIGAWYLGLLASPFWGICATRYRLYRPLFFATFAVTGVSCALLPLTHELWMQFLTAVALGAGSGGAATLASLFIVDFTPKSDWVARIGILQSFNGAGQVFGLLLAALLSRLPFDIGLWIAAALLSPALVLGRIGLPVAPAPENSRRARRHLHRLVDVPGLAVFPRVNLVSGVGFHISPLNLSGLRRLPRAMRSVFGRFLLSWWLFAFGVAGFFAYLPLLFTASYGLPPQTTSWLYALGAGVGVALFVLSGRWSERHGAAPIYRTALWLRVGGFMLLLVLGLIPGRYNSALAGAAFVLIVLAWPLISVSATDLAAHLTPFSEGAALGLFNATTSLGTVLGAFASAPLVHLGGYRTIALMAILSLLVAIHVGRVGETA